MFFSCRKKPSEKSASEAETLGSGKPNIIFLLTDDHRWDALGAMGNPIVQTPHLDKLAKKGLLFKNAYVTTSICCVSRASILTGQYESRHKINDFNTSLSPEAVQHTYPILLKDAGYQIGFVGKYGVGAPKDQPKELYDFWECSTKGQPDYELTDEKGNYLHHTDKVGQDINKFLDQVGDQKPFCLSVSFKAPHVQDGNPKDKEYQDLSRQFIIQPRYKEYYQNVSIPVPETADPKYWESFPDFFQTEENIARERWRLRFETPEKYQESVKNYYRLLTGVDDVVGNMVKELEEKGLADNTIIIFTGDNGFYLGEHGLAGKWYGHEESIRVPLIIYDPRRGNRNRGETPDKIALNVDIAPTILGLAGTPVPEGMQGVDLMQLTEGKKKALERQDFFYEHTFMGSPKLPKVEGVVSREMKYMNFIEHGYEELYDLRKDPLEKKNLAGDPAYEKELQKMRGRYQELKEKAAQAPRRVDS
jgi:arylsulfatase A-like enzyme